MAAANIKSSSASERIGLVSSDRMSKTIVVKVERRFKHPQFKKTVTVTKKFYAHDESELAGVGDVVLIRESRPLSKLKRWELVGILEAAKQN